jgi:hypothetical protein
MADSKISGLTAGTPNATDTFPFERGGTANFAASGASFGAGTILLPYVAPGTSGNVLTSNGTAWTSAAPSNSITFDTIPDADVSASGEKGTLNANENQAFSDVVYINADGQAQIGDADAIASSVIMAMAIATISADADGVYLFKGFARKDAWTWTPGGLIYLSTTGTTGNTLTQTAPSGTDDCIVILGVATHADRMYFNPQLVIVEHV